MVKLTYNTKKDVIVMIHKGKSVAFLDTKDFGALTHEVMRIMEEANPAIKKIRDKNKKKAQWKAERRRLINQLKIMIAIKFIDFARKIKSFFN